MLHVTIMSSRIDEAVEFYEKAVGLRIVRDNRGTDHAIVFLHDSADEVSVEIADNPGDAFSGSGIALGFEVEDVEAKRAELEAAGYAPGPVLSPDPHARFFFMADPDGVNLQFVHES